MKGSLYDQTSGSQSVLVQNAPKTVVTNGSGGIPKVQIARVNQNKPDWQYHMTLTVKLVN
ncbi:hypothetical protein FRX31_012870 [Thalictrum thalictroides]|uniref:Uncharacterized protein n=1 Tax=Thalictrum thalictroides TaxID=46969 RepID=A0A7J6WJJ6_THATH|nr:hypothetical protein FRX31_012870 [Thalictrum thalictroides]